MSAAEEAFQRYVVLSEPYFDAVRAAGDVPWFEPGSGKRAGVVERLGLGSDVSDVDLRRGLFMRRYGISGSGGLGQ